MQKLSYSQAIKRSHREAVYTVIAALLLFIFFWAAIALTDNNQEVLWGLPLWFWLSCIGGYVFSVIVVCALVKFFFLDFDLKTPDESDAGDAQ